MIRLTYYYLCILLLLTLQPAGWLCECVVRFPTRRQKEDNKIMENLMIYNTSSDRWYHQHGILENTRFHPFIYISTKNNKKGKGKKKKWENYSLTYRKKRISSSSVSKEQIEANNKVR